MKTVQNRVANCIWAPGRPLHQEAFVLHTSAEQWAKRTSGELTDWSECRKCRHNLRTHIIYKHNREFSHRHPLLSLARAHTSTYTAEQAVYDQGIGLCDRRWWWWQRRWRRQHETNTRRGCSRTHTYTSSLSL